MRAPGLVVHEARNSLVASSLPASILLAPLTPLAAKTLAERCPELVEGSAESRIGTAFWPEPQFFLSAEPCELPLPMNWQLLLLGQLCLRASCLALRLVV
jgi:hypothetical protein